MSIFTLAALYFLVYSFSGWVFEVIYLFIVDKKLRLDIGFLTAPALPIYGASALAILLIVQPHIQNPFLVFAASAMFVTVIEYITATALDKFFQVRLWCYNKMPLNIQGKVSLPTSLGFGVVGLFLVYVLHPLLQPHIESIPPNIAEILAIILLTLVLIDALNSTISLIRTRLDNRKLQGSLDDIQRLIDGTIEDLRDRRKKLRLYTQKIYRYNLRRLRKAFPNAKLTYRNKKK